MSLAVSVREDFNLHTHRTTEIFRDSFQSKCKLNIENVNPIIVQVARCFADGTTFKEEVNLKSRKTNSKFCFYPNLNHKI